MTTTVQTRATVIVHSSPSKTHEVVVTRSRGDRIANIAEAAARKVWFDAFSQQTSVGGEYLDSSRTLEDYGIDDETPIQVDVWFLPFGHFGR